MTQPAPNLWRDENGHVFQVDPREAGTAQKAGWVPASKEDVDAALARKEAGSASGIAKTAAEGLGAGAYDALTAIPRVATALGSAALGKEDPFAEATGRNALEALRYAGGRAAGESHEEANRASYAYGDRQKLRANVNPGTATGTSILGQIAGSAGIGALGEGAASGVTGALTKTGQAAGVGARLAGAAARGLTEGAVYGVTGAQDQAYLENRKLTGEQVLATAGLSALLGGGLGFATSGLGEIFGAAKGAASDVIAGKAGAADKPNAIARDLDRAPSAADVEKLAEKQFGEAAPGVGEKWVKAYSKAASAVSGADSDTIEKLTSLGPEGRAARKLATDGDAIREEAARSMRGHIDELNGASQKLQEEYMGGLKEGHVESAIRKGKDALGQQLEFAQGHIDAVTQKAEEMLADPTAYGQVADVKKLVRFSKLAQRAVDTAEEEGSGTKAMMALDNMKKQLGRLAKPGSFLTTSSDKAVTQEVRGLYEGLRTGLEDEGMWGKAGADQARINGAWSKYLDTKQLFDQRLSTQLGRDPSNPWVRSLTADPAKIDAYVNGLTSAKNDLIHQTIRDHLENSKQLADALSELTDMKADKLAEVGKVYRSTAAFDKTLGQAENQLVVANQLRALQQAGGKSVAGMAATAGAFIGGAPGAAIGGALGTAYDVLRNPGQLVGRMSALERMAETAQSKMGGQLNDFFSNMGSAAQKSYPIASKVVSRTVNATRSAALPTAVEAFMGKHKTPEAAYRARVEELAAASENFGGKIRDNAARGFGDLVHQEPQAVGSAVIAATNAVNYLQQQIPQGVFNANSFTPKTSQLSPSRAEIAKFATVWQAVDKPISVLRDLNNGTITRDQVDAIHAVYPRLYDWIRGETMTRLRDMDERGEEVPIRQRLLLDTLLDLDGAGEPAFSSSFAAKYAAGMKDVPQQQPKQGGGGAPRSSGGKSKVASLYATGTNAMLGGSES